MSQANNEVSRYSGTKCYVIVSPRGLEYVGMHSDEKDAWRVALGWPTVGEVRLKKELGWYCAEANLTWIRPSGPENS